MNNNNDCFKYQSIKRECRLTSCRILRSSSRILSAGRLLSGRGLIHSFMAVITPLSMNVSFRSCLHTHISAHYCAFLSEQTLNTHTLTSSDASPLWAAAWASSEPVSSCCSDSGPPEDTNTEQTLNPRLECAFETLGSVRIRNVFESVLYRNRWNLWFFPHSFFSGFSED